MVYFLSAQGVIAQLVERLNGIEEVWGSNPHGSTPLLKKVEEEFWSVMKEALVPLNCP